MELFWLLLSIALSSSAAGDHLDLHAPVSMTMGTAQSHDQASPPQLSELVEQQEAPWRQEVLDQLRQLVQVQKEIAKSQNQVVQLLSMLGNQGSQQIKDLQNLARHQSLLVENHQALLLQTSRIATHLHEVAKKPAPPIPAPDQ